MLCLFPAPRPCALCLFAASPAFACSSCGCSLTSDWLSQGLVSVPGTVLSLRYDDVPQTRLQDGRVGVDRSAIALPTDREIEHYTYNHYVTATLDHQFNSVWGIDLQVPRFTARTSRPRPAIPTSAPPTPEGLGDVRISGRWQGFGGSGITGVQFGLKLPTGSFHEHFLSGPSAGQETDRGLQPGSGTIDALVGAYHYGRIAPKVDVILQALAQIPLDSREGYKPATGVNFSAGFHYTGWAGITPQLQFNARVASKDSGVNADPDHSGGELVYVAPGGIVRLSPRASAFAYVQVPVLPAGYRLPARADLYGIDRGSTTGCRSAARRPLRQRPWRRPFIYRRKNGPVWS